MIGRMQFQIYTFIVVPSPLKHNLLQSILRAISNDILHATNNYVKIVRALRAHVSCRFQKSFVKLVLVGFSNDMSHVIKNLHLQDFQLLFPLKFDIKVTHIGAVEHPQRDGRTQSAISVLENRAISNDMLHATKIKRQIR